MYTSLNVNNITICIAHFNNSALLERCLHSIQRLKANLDVVIVDDSSEEAEFKRAQNLISAFKFKNQILARNLVNRGVTFTKNRAFKLAQDGWCVFLDCDDFFEQKEADRAMRFLSNYNGEIVLFHCYNDESVSAITDEDRLIELSEYCSEGTGGEALTALNKNRISKPPYYGALRGYEGLGIMRIMKNVAAPLLLSKLRPRIYTSDSGIQLSRGMGFYNRLPSLVAGHYLVIRDYSDYLSWKRKFKLLILICYYSALRVLYK